MNVLGSAAGGACWPETPTETCSSSSRTPARRGDAAELDGAVSPPIDRRTDDFGVSFNAPIPGLKNAMLLSDAVAINLDVEAVLQSDGA